MPLPIVVTANHTGAGKSVAAAVLATGLGAHYWKPIQAGTEEETDSEWVRRVTEGKVPILPEAYRLTQPRSPHAAATADGVSISLDTLLQVPAQRPLVIEGAGGLMVPLSHDLLFADLVRQWGFPVVLVMHTYLGSINHTLLTAEALSQRGIQVLGLVVNDGGYPESADFVLRRTGYPLLGTLPRFAQWGAAALQDAWRSHFHWPPTA